jgi:hypothetical protein
MNQSMDRTSAGGKRPGRAATNSSSLKALLPLLRLATALKLELGVVSQ